VALLAGFGALDFSLLCRMIVLEFSVLRAGKTQESARRRPWEVPERIVNSFLTALLSFPQQQEGKHVQITKREVGDEKQRVLPALNPGESSRPPSAFLPTITALCCSFAANVSQFSVRNSPFATDFSQPSF
jgi:hypothetical protein